MLAAEGDPRFPLSRVGVAAVDDDAAPRPERLCGGLDAQPAGATLILAHVSQAPPDRLAQLPAQGRLARARQSHKSEEQRLASHGMERRTRCLLGRGEASSRLNRRLHLSNWRIANPLRSAGKGQSAQIGRHLVIQRPEAGEVGEELVALAAARNLEQAPPLQSGIGTPSRSNALLAGRKAVQRHVAGRLDFDPAEGGVHADKALLLHRIECARRCLDARQVMRAGKLARLRPAELRSRLLDVLLHERRQIPRADEGERRSGVPHHDRVSRKAELKGVAAAGGLRQPVARRRKRLPKVRGEGPDAHSRHLARCVGHAHRRDVPAVAVVVEGGDRAVKLLVHARRAPVKGLADGGRRRLICVEELCEGQRDHPPAPLLEDEPATLLDNLVGEV
mmetsp:Transcript_50980/g.168831  ORF Transcript_50980/g.168831 Transcript_50980/m.168831 type:complete len:392 (+) Transcript_50980:394-1569(+)